MHPFLIFFIAIDFLCLSLHDDVIGNHCEPDNVSKYQIPNYLKFVGCKECIELVTSIREKRIIKNNTTGKE